ESKALDQRKDPMVIISAPGMAEAGRVLHHLKNNVEDPLNTVCIVAWEAANTLGRRLADREKRISIVGEPYAVPAEIATIGGLSAHAGQDLLTEYAMNVRETVKNVFLVHGEQQPAAALRDRLSERGMHEVFYPALHSSAEL